MELSTISKNIATGPGLNLEKEQLNALINSMADGVLATDDAGRIVLSNGAALNILDVNSTLYGRFIKDVIKPFDKNGQAIDFQTQVISTQTQFVGRDWLLHYDDGSKINLYISIAPVHLGYGSGGQNGFVILIRDITREKSLEEERDEFISVVSHELRTPIAIAEGNIGNVEFIMEKAHNQDESIRQALRQAHDQINFLSSLINDLATLSRAERGTLEVQVEAINAHGLCTDLASDYKDQVTKKGLKLLTDFDPNLELRNT